MSLRNALATADNIEVKKGILTISTIDNNFLEIVTYSCFIQDIELNHPQLGNGRLIEFTNGKWICDFDYSTSLQEIKTKTLINYLN